LIFVAGVENPMADSKNETRPDRQSRQKVRDDALERMNKALKAALETPPKKHKDEPKRPRSSISEKTK
jgi:hypothetical protein